MNKLIAISVLLLIGCSPVSPDKQEEADSYPIPLGIWESERYGTIHDFTGLAYEGELSIHDKGAIAGSFKSVELKTFWTTLPAGKVYTKTFSRKGYWFKKDDTIYARYLDFEDNRTMILSYNIDRGSLIGNQGDRWYKQKEGNKE